MDLVLFLLLFVVIFGGGMAAFSTVVSVVDRENELLDSVSSIADSPGCLADHLEHSCDKCKAEAESEDTTNPS